MSANTTKLLQHAADSQYFIWRNTGEQFMNTLGHILCTISPNNDRQQ